MFTLDDTDTDTIGFQTHSVVGVGKSIICVGVGKCEQTIIESTLNVVETHLKAMSLSHSVSLSVNKSSVHTFRTLQYSLKVKGKYKPAFQKKPFLCNWF